MKQYYGQQTEMALANFPFPLPIVSLRFIYAIAEVKRAAAYANGIAGDLDEVRQTAIIHTCDEILSGKFDDQFVTPSIQGGAGTSINMNVNEVIAERANETLAEQGKTERVHPNDHVNMSQSTNDVNPTALRICSIWLLKNLLIELEKLAITFRARSKENNDVHKLGRTHIQDAVPTTIGAEFAAYASIIERDIKKLQDTFPYLCEVNIGGTAIGNGINAKKEYRDEVCNELASNTQIDLVPTANGMAGTSSTGDFCQLMALVYGTAVNLSKIANDIRFMASGPKGGIGEITLEALQPGSSIMPGKINPVAAESINQISYFIAGKNTTVHNATENAHMELAVMFPVIAESIISSLELLTAGVSIFNTKCIATLIVNKEACERHLEQSMAYATLFTPRFGYETVSKAVKQAIKEGKTLREILVSTQLVSEEEFNNIIHSYES
jgi:aspartate ammonia-lyase